MVRICRVNIPTSTTSSRSHGVSTRSRTSWVVTHEIPRNPTKIGASLSNPIGTGIKFFHVRFEGAIASTWRSASEKSRSTYPENFLEYGAIIFF